MSVLYYVEKEYRTELIEDFRVFYHTSFYEMELNEALDLIPALLRKSESSFYAKWHKTEAFSSEARMLQLVQNAIIASIPAKKGQEWRKKEALVTLPKPQPHSFVVTETVSVRSVERRYEAAGWGRLNSIHKEKNLGL